MMATCTRAKKALGRITAYYAYQNAVHQAVSYAVVLRNKGDDAGARALLAFAEAIEKQADTHFGDVVKAKGATL